MGEAKQTPTTTDSRDLWCVGAGDPAYVFVPGIVKPIKVGSAERAARIVQCVNAHDELEREVAYLRERLTAAADDFATCYRWFTQAGRSVDANFAMERSNAYRRPMPEALKSLTTLAKATEASA